MEQVGRYRISQELGQGPRGSVYKAQDQQTGRVIAIKTVRLGDIEVQGHREHLRATLLKGVQSAEALSHPNIATLYGVVEQDGVACLLTEYSAATSLKACLDNGSVQDGESLLHFLRQIAEGLDYAHRKGIIHGNLKPENVLVSEGGQALERHAELTDYGLAKFVVEDISVPGRSPILASYFSPEQIRDGLFSSASDQFALAAVVYEILTGKKPFRAGTLPELADAICLQNLTPLQDFDGTLSDTVDRVLQKAMAKNPARRFPTCSAFVGTLSIALGDCPNWSAQGKKTPGSVPAVVNETAQAFAATQAVGAATPAMATMLPAKVMSPPPAVSALPIEEDIPEIPAQQFDYRSAYGKMEADKTGLLSRRKKIAIGVAAIAVLGVAGVFFSGWRPEPEMPTQVLDPSAGPVSPPPKEDRILPVPKKSPLAAPRTSPTVPPKKTPVAVPQRQEQAKVEQPRPFIPRAEVPKPVRPVADAGPFELLSEPPGAKITVDGDAALVCTAPCTLNLSNGRHTAVVEMNGYGLARRIFNIPESSSLIVTLTRNMGAVLLTSTPSGSDVSVDGAPRGKTPVTLRLPVGPHRISMTYNGMKHDETIEIENDAMTARAFRW